MLKETIENLNIKEDGIYVDGTTGGGGHALQVVKHLSDKGRFFGIDQDDAAIAAATERLADYAEKVTLIRSNYCQMKEVLSEYGVEKVDGIVLDLGVSSYQLYTEERGFSYRIDTPLDMRMDRRQSLTAKDIVNGYPEKDGTVFGSERTITRAEAATIISRMLFPESTDGIKAVTDTKIMSGTSPGNFDKTANITRAQLAKIYCNIKEYCKNLEK